ncbi:MAG: hypothetical protein HY300_21040 [Verrucomicrobia bacterium]|nr:hypothetical protein [Verrucomicrobiota bacterium]
MRRPLVLLLLFTASLPVRGADARLLKVLPHYLDAEGRHALSPSLYERDAYQAQLRKKPELVSALRFDVQWKAKSKSDLKLRVEVRGGKPDVTPVVLEQFVTPARWGSSWTSVVMGRDAYEQMGGMVAWRATLWRGDERVAEQKSFLW